MFSPVALVIKMKPENRVNLVQEVVSEPQVLNFDGSTKKSGSLFCCSVGHHRSNRYWRQWHPHDDHPEVQEPALCVWSVHAELLGRFGRNDGLRNLVPFDQLLHRTLDAANSWQGWVIRGGSTFLGARFQFPQ